MQPKIVCLGLTIFFNLTIVAKSEDPISCNPSVLGSDVVVNVTWDSRSHFQIMRNYISVMFCATNIPCFFKHPNDYKHFETQAGENRRKVTITVPNVTTAAADTWILNGKGGYSFNKTCIVTLFSKDIDCQKTMSTDGVDIQCVTREAFPKVKCCFKIINKDTLSNPMLGKIEYTHQAISLGNIYTNAACKVPIALKDKTVKFDVEVAMFPDATGNDSDMEMGSRVILPIDLFLSVSCTPTPEGGTSNLSITWNKITSIEISRNDRAITINCLPDTPCHYRKEEGYIMNVQPASGGRSTLTLSFHNVTRLGSSKGGVSWTVAIKGTSRSVTETCRLYEPVVNINCNYKPLVDGLNITCNSPWKFSSRRCQFKAGKEMERIVSETIAYHDLEDKTFCNTLIPWNMLETKQPVVYVTVFPNVTGDVKDVIYGKTTAVEVVIESPPVELKECPLKVERGETVSCTCVSSSSNVTVFWNSKSSKLHENTNTITFLASAFADYYCNGENYLGAIGLPKIYKPQIVYPPFVKFGSDLSSNETAAEKLYITCISNNKSGTLGNLEEERDVVAWRTEQNMQQSERNIEQCEKAKFYKCILLTDYDILKKDFIDCGLRTESKADSGDLIVVLSLVFIVTGVVIGGLFILRKVKPSVFFCLSNENNQEEAGSDL